MARFRERFEVKNEMTDGAEIKPDDAKQNGGKSSTLSQEETDKVANSVGFDDELSMDDTGEALEEYMVANSQVVAELEQYYDEDITPEELKAYLVSKITEIYGEKLEKCNISIDSFVDGFLENNEFSGANSYKQLARSAEETIKDITSRMKETKNVHDSRTEETGFVLKSINGRDILSSAIEATEEVTKESTISEQSKTISIMQKERSDVSKDTQTI